MVTSTGKPITHSQLLIRLLKAVLLPFSLALCKCQAHTSGKDTVSCGNRLADQVAKAAAQGDFGCSDLFAVQETDTLIDHSVLADMQSHAPAAEKHLWKTRGAVFSQDGLFVVNGKPVLPKSLFKAAALLTHGPCHVSTGGMTHLIQQHFTTYNLESYLKNFCRSCLICVKHNPQGNIRPKHSFCFSMPCCRQTFPLGHSLCEDVIPLNGYNMNSQRSHRLLTKPESSGIAYLNLTYLSIELTGSPYYPPWNSSDHLLEVPSPRGMGTPDGYIWKCGNTLYLYLPKDWCGTCSLARLQPSSYVFSEEGVRLKTLELKKREFKPVQAYVPILTDVTALLANDPEKQAMRTMLMQHQLALDSLFASRGGLCTVIGEHCCTYLPSTRGNWTLIHDRVKNLGDFLKARESAAYSWDLMTWLTSGSWFTILMKFLMPFVVFFLLIFILAGCVIPCARSMMTKTMTNVMIQHFFMMQKEGAHIYEAVTN
uniref:RNase H type-1 domain-containing protein n=1 Tax=Nothobranchius furzeri TaxID=105023 RepID=A0A8C6NRS4_NOTFU